MELEGWVVFVIPSPRDMIIVRNPWQTNEIISCKYFAGREDPVTKQIN